jgi:SAM-dependent methyltransferase
MTVDAEYVLGANDAEIERLGMQHAVWRSDAARGWRAAGFRPGHTLVDVGSGPGFAALDLAELVGPTGCIHAVDQSRRFLSYLDAQAAARGLGTIVTTAASLTEFEFDGIEADGAWIRWVLAFVAQPRLVLERLARVLKPRSRVVVHEYYAYENWKILPRDAEFERFVARIMESWRQRGGEPNIGIELPDWFEQLGFGIVSVRTIADVVRTDDARWYWPAAFALSGLERLLELGDITPTDGQQLRARLRQIVDDRRWMLTPAVLEIVAQAP